MIDPKATVITIDGPSGAGKGTVAQRIARRLDFHLLDSGAVYRAAALHALDVKADLGDEQAVVSACHSLNVEFDKTSDSGVRVLFGEKDVTADLRSELTADAASRIAVMPAVRTVLLQMQRDFQQTPGLVADGRDMGTVVFPDAHIKVFLTASSRIRAERRYKQLNQQGIDATLEGLMEEIEARDLRDSTRKTAPLVAADDALVIDSTSISIERVTQIILQAVEEKQDLVVP